MTIKKLSRFSKFLSFFTDKPDKDASVCPCQAFLALAGKAGSPGLLCLGGAPLGCYNMPSANAPTKSFPNPSLIVSNPFLLIRD